MTRAPASTVVSETMKLVSPAEDAFLSRWRMTTLERLDKELHDRVAEQRDLYHSAQVTGSDAELRDHAAAMVRGWRAACQRMEAPLQPDDAYMVGHDLMTGTHVVIAERTSAAARAQTVDGITRKLVTPDEVAKLLAAFETINQAKSLFPDAEVVAMECAA
jgi:predicted exporter